jgi:hypothetical protein
MGTKCAPIQHKNVIYSLLQNFYIEVITCVRLARELPFAHVDSIKKRHNVFHCCYFRFDGKQF